MAGMRRRHRKLIHEGGFAAEVDVELIDSEAGWSPYLTIEDAEKLDDVRTSLRQGDIARASTLARIYRLMPISA